MKCTLNIDQPLLERVVIHTGAATKTEAIHLALKEIDRRAQLLATLRQGTGAEDAEVASLFAPAAEEAPSLRAAEAPTAYVAKRKP